MSVALHDAAPVIARPARAAVPQERRARDRYVDAMSACAAIYLFTTVGRVHQLFPILGLVRPALIGAIGVLFLFMVDGRRAQGFWRTLWSWPGQCLLGFTIWMTFSVPGALFLGNSVTVLTSFVKTFAMCIALAGLARGPRDVERLVFVYFVCIALYAVVVITRFPDVDWRTVHLYYYDSNDLAVLCVTAVAPGLHFAMTPRPLWQRLGGMLGLPPLLTAIVLSNSRGGFLGLLVVTGLIIIGLSRIPWRWRLIGIVAVCVGLSFAGTDTYWTRMTTIVHPETDYNETSDTGRLKVWARGIGYMLDHSLFGVGAGNFPVAEGTLSPLAERQDYGLGVKWSAAHNSYVQVGAELGIPGLVLFLGILGSTFGGLTAVRRGRHGDAYRHGERAARLAGALQVSLAGFAVGGFFLSLGYNEMLYALVALSIALRRVAGPVIVRPTAAP